MSLQTLEQDTRVLVDKMLENLGYSSTDNNGEFKHIYREQPRTKNEHKKLAGKRPDYVIYSKETDTPIIIIETKKKGEKIDKALDQGIFYAKKLEAPIVFATDGVFCKAYHSKFNKTPTLNGQEIDEFIRESLALKYLNSWEVNTISPKVQYDRKELIKIFDESNNMLRGEGLRAGIERFGEFSNILFLKLISESEDIKKERGEITSFNPVCHWDYIKSLNPASRIEHINKIVYEKLNVLYKTDIFTPLLLKDQFILKDIIDKLDPLKLSDVDSDVKGDAFEFFLKESTASGNDLGEYFTPRHIVKTMVKLVNPQIGEKIYDPFCGTGGLLIESFRHIWNTMARTPRNIETLKQSTIFGNEITNTARITKMNMILAGDGHSNINMIDSLSTPISNKFDVVVTNMPYSQKTKHFNKYDVPSKNGDSICVQHCIKSINGLSENGRMAIVVPEGFLFRKDLEKTREYLLEKCNLKSVISLPQGVFLPYTGVKTDILYCEKINNTKRKNELSKHFWYFDVKSDGYSLDNHRRKLDGKNDLDNYQEYRKLEDNQSDNMLTVGFSKIYFDEVRRNNLVLIGSRYKKQEILNNTKYSLLTIKQLIDSNYIKITKGKPITKQKSQSGDFPVIAGGQKSPYSHNMYNFSGQTITVSSSGAYSGFVWFHDYPIWASDCFVITTDELNNKIRLKYLYYILKHKQDDIYLLQHGSGQPHVYQYDISNIQIPLPNLDIQDQVVKKLDSFKEIANNASKILLNYRPYIQCKKIISQQPIKKNFSRRTDAINPQKESGLVKYIGLENIESNTGRLIGNIETNVKDIKSTKYCFKKGDILVAKLRPNLNKVYFAEFDGICSTDFIVLRSNNKDIIAKYYSILFLSEEFNNLLRNGISGGQLPRLNVDYFLNTLIPIVHVSEQLKSLDKIDKEKNSVYSMSSLENIFNQKMSDYLDSLF